MIPERPPAPVPDPSRCAMVGCGHPHKVRGFCHKHYRKLLAGGNLKPLTPEKRRRRRAPTPADSNRVSANRALLPESWWHDPMMREYVDERIAECIRIGMSAPDTARRVGVNVRTVVRHRARVRANKERMGTAA